MIGRRKWYDMIDDATYCMRDYNSYVFCCGKNENNAETKK